MKKARARRGRTDGSQQCTEAPHNLSTRLFLVPEQVLQPHWTSECHRMPHVWPGHFTAGMGLSPDMPRAAMNIAEAKARINFRELVTQTPDIDRMGRIKCPVHQDEHPSCQIYFDHAHCFACGWQADVITWLEVLHGLSAKDALKEATRLTGPVLAPKRQRGLTSEKNACGTDPLPDGMLKRHVARVEHNRCVPAAIVGRGISEEDLSILMIADCQGDALFPILGPTGAPLNIKRRHLNVQDGPRYSYLVSGRGAPAWCSPRILKAPEVLVMEGELNAMVSWLVRPDLGVMGAAGAGGCLHLELLRGRTVYVYADGDEPGAKARERWARQACEAGAARVIVVEPWPDGDACDVAGRLGRAALRERLS